MMNCHQCRQLLSEYHEAELDEKLAADVRKHLARCRKCRRESDTYGKISTLANCLTRHEPGAETVLKIKSAIYEQARLQHRTQFGPVLTADELAEFLRIDTGVLEQYMEEIPCFELGGKILFLRKSLEKWIENREKGLGIQMFESRINQVLHIPELEGGRRWKI